jgi:hypothetical protein
MGAVLHLHEFADGVAVFAQSDTHTHASVYVSKEMKHVCIDIGEAAGRQAALWIRYDTARKLAEMLYKKLGMIVPVSPIVVDLATCDDVAVCKRALEIMADNATLAKGMVKAWYESSELAS